VAVTTVDANRTGLSACIVCANLAFHELFMSDKEAFASSLIQGLLMPLGSKSTLKNYKAMRRGVCIVERCARTIEAPCAGCQRADCERCAISAELRAAETRILAERDAELDSDTYVEAVLNEMIEDLCPAHMALGSSLAGQWYGRRSFQSVDTTHNDP